VQAVYISTIAWLQDYSRWAEEPQVQAFGLLVPQRLKPIPFSILTARLKPGPWYEAVFGGNWAHLCLGLLWFTESNFPFHPLL